jgi:hypothetical protein
MDDWRSGLSNEEAILVAALEAGEGRPVSRDEAERFLDEVGAYPYQPSLTAHSLYALLLDGSIVARREGDTYSFRASPEVLGGPSL